MDWLDEARKAFGKAAEGVSRGADIVRLETEIADLSRRTTEAFAAVGRRAQVLVKLERTQDPELRSLAETAENIEEKLRAAQEQLQGIRQGKRIRRCPGCGATVVKLSETCEQCGAKLPVCKECLEPLSADDETCPQCGAAVGSGS
jgi:DNA repair exonuclease SbcCD ATPase subunit